MHVVSIKSCLKFNKESLKGFIVTYKFKLWIICSDRISLPSDGNTKDTDRRFFENGK